MTTTGNKKDSSSKGSSKTAAKTDAKADSTSTESGQSSSESSTSGSFTRGERQKVVTDSYRNSWDRIFTKKRGS